MNKRALGKSKIKVNPLGLGCMRLARKGWFFSDGREIDMGPSDDVESVRAIHQAIDLGVNLFDTADVYGAGSNERLLGRAIRDRRDEVVVVSKGGHVFDEATRTLIQHPTLDRGEYIAPQNIKSACEASLKRLDTDYIDVYLLHSKNTDRDYDLENAAIIRENMEELVSEGKIRGYGWSTDWPHQLEVFLKGEHCIADELDFNVLFGNEETLRLAEENELTIFNRRPLAGGELLKPSENEDDKLSAIREILTQGGRTVAQGALCWLWAKSPNCIPVPGFRNIEQMLGLVGALNFDPLNAGQIKEIEELKES